MSLTGQTVELLQALIRNECVNDGTIESGGETRNSDTLTNYLGATGLEVQQYESHPGRGSMVARIEGSDPTAPTLCFMGHTDVVPVNADGWRHDPFGGEIIDGEVWGRGAIDMLNLTSSMAVAFRHLAETGFTPKGTLIYFGVADEEAGGTHGAEWMLEHHAEDIMADYVLTELGGWSTVDEHGTRKVTVNIGEKGLAWRRLRVKGTPGHGSMPFGADNALIKAAEVVRRLSEYRPVPHLDDVWEAQVNAMRLTPEQRAALSDPEQIYDAIAAMPVAKARTCHAQSHTTISPNVAHGGQKTNTIPDVIDLDVDIRVVPGTTREDVAAMLDEALGDLAPHVEISDLQNSAPTRSPMDNPLWDAVADNTQIAYPGAEIIPGLIVGGTDARFYRQRGSVAYGAGLFSPKMDFATFGTRFHGNDERIDIDSLELATDFWVRIAKQMLE